MDIVVNLKSSCECTDTCTFDTWTDLLTRPPIAHSMQTKAWPHQIHEAQGSQLNKTSDKELCLLGFVARLSHKEEKSNV